MRPVATAGSIVALMLLASAAPLPAQDPTISVDPIECLPVLEHGLAYARVDNQPPGTEVRVYFRRFHEVVEDFYWIEMEPAGNGVYWAALPKPDDEENDRFDLEERLRKTEEEEDHPWAAWWREKELSDHRDPNDELDEEEIRERASRGKLEKRSWMEAWDLEAFEEWLEEQHWEPAEYYAALVAPAGQVLAVSAMRITPVIDEDDCPVEMTPRQEGFSRNLTVGETAPWQIGEPVFHWLCDHVVTRVDYREIWREDEVCRACVIAWWKRKGLLIPLGSAAGVVGVIEILDDDEPVSPSRP